MSGHAAPSGHAALRDDARLARVLEALAARQARPRSAYRVQFHKGFTFRDAEAIVPYLAALGVSHLYASPFLKARPGSTHGYDIAEHGALNPEIGSPDDYEALHQTLAAHGMGQILDVVPNHMGVAGGENLWWLDVLENGPASPYARFFDIDWNPIKEELRNKVLLPVLGDQYGQVLESRELKLVFEAEAGRFWITYYENRWPVAPGTVPRILSLRIEELAAALGTPVPTPAGAGVSGQAAAAAHPALLEYQSIITAARNLPRRDETDPARVAEQQLEKEAIKRRLAALCRAEPAIRRHVEENVRIFNGVKGEPRSFDRLDELLAEQAYRLAYWRVAAEEINYRRFFDVNDLAAVRVNDPAVFEATHRLVLDLLRRGRLEGLRIDHPDGLFDPLGYFRTVQRAWIRLVCEEVVADGDGSGDGPPAEPAPAVDGRGAGEDGRRAGQDARQAREDARRAAVGALVAAVEARGLEDPAGPAGRPLFLVVEKVLGRDEALPEDWPVWGTVGYEYLNALGGLFVAPDDARRLDELYTRVVGRRVDFGELGYTCKKLIMYAAMASETNVLGHQLNRLSERNRWSRDFTLYSLTQALREIIACFPVYRTYICAPSDRVSERDRAYVEQAVQRAKRLNPATDASIFEFIRNVLLLRFPTRLSEEDRALQREFVMKFQQVTGPVTAKGVEDTAFYRYSRLVSLNEVGGDPERIGLDPAVFHRMNQERLALWPGALATTSTHDTKRSEDVRARIHVLAEVARDWRSAVGFWRRINARKKTVVDGRLAPDDNDEYLLYQTLVGSWPLEGASGEALAAYRERIQGYMAKATREAKVNTSWINPNPDYDGAVRDFVAALLDEAPDNRFLADLRAFQGRIVRLGLLGSLAQTVLKLASPGVPDLYQGTEVWDFSLVDPDNRRPVDYPVRASALEDLRARIAANDLPAVASELAARLSDPRTKLFVVHLGLAARQADPDLYARGAYLPLEPQGVRADHVVGFARHLAEPGRLPRSALAAVPRFTARLLRAPEALPLGPEVWGDTFLPLPPEVAARRFANRFTGERLPAEQRNGRAGLPAAALFGRFPVALLASDEEE